MLFIKTYQMNKFHGKRMKSFKHKKISIKKIKYITHTQKYARGTTLNTRFKALIEAREFSNSFADLK